MSSLIFAHRGACGYAPENTLDAFRLGMEMGADGFELDVHLSRDGVPVVIHDETVDRTTDGTGLVRELTLSQLKALDASNGMKGYQNTRIPTLAEVFELIRNTRHIVNVEVKTDDWFYPQIEEKCLALAKEMGVEDRVIYSSFNHNTLLKLRSLKPDAKLGVLFGDILAEPWDYIGKLHVDLVHPMKMNIYLPHFAADAAKNGLGLNVWTVNDEATMETCLACNAGIITNYPDVAVKLRSKAETLPG